MRKDKGLNGDLDRLPMLTWVMFLKFLDDSERMREQEAQLAGEKFVPAIATPYRWRDWAAKADGITGDELIAFINQEECKRTAETAMLFLQLIMRKLRRAPKPGRAAVVVPNGTLFGDGVCARIKEELLKQFNLHTIVRLPNGVFAPYTGIPTNILFFDRSGPTKEVWYYEQPLPEGRKNYTKTAPIQFEEFAPCIAWWNNRQENERAWRVPCCLSQGLQNLPISYHFLPFPMGPIQSQNKKALDCGSSVLECLLAAGPLVKPIPE